MKYLVASFLLVLISIISFADSGKIFRGNRDSIVLVTAYGSKGDALTEGTGFIASPDGAVITNYHVIGIAKDIKVKTNGNVLNVDGVIYADSENDFVILHVKGKNLPTVSLGNTGKLNPGDKVYVISSSEDSEAVIHEGVLRNIKMFSPKGKALEITVPVSHGSSGSPVLNDRGEVIGVVTFLTKRHENIITAMPVELFKDKLRSNSLISLKEAIKAYQKTPEYWFYLGYFLLEAGAHKESVDVFREAIRIRPAFADAYYYRGTAYEKTGKYKEAVRDYKKAIRLNPDLVDAHFSLGAVYGKLGMYKETLDILQKAVLIDPGFADAYYNMGVAYGKLGMYQEAIEAGKHAVRIKPDFADANYNLGIAYEKTGKYRDATVAFQKVLDLRPDYAEAHYNLGLVHLLLKDKGSALERYNRLKLLNRELANKLLALIYK